MFTRATDTIRYHVPFLKEWYSLPDGTHYLPGYKPKFLEPSCTSQDDLNAVIDNVRGECRAVRESNTDAFAEPRTSDEPEIEILAALTHQADLSTCTKRPARNSRKKELVERVFTATLDSWKKEK